MGNAALLRGPFPAAAPRGSAAAAGGTFVATFDTTLAEFTDRVFRMQFTVLISNLSAGHLQNACVLSCECVAANKNGTVTLLAALAGSTNPMNSNTAGYLAAVAEASDAAFNTCTAVITAPATNKITVTVTNNNGAGVVADVTVSCDYELVGGSV